jgi:hypothetical protein
MHLPPVATHAPISRCSGYTCVARSISRSLLMMSSHLDRSHVLLARLRCRECCRCEPLARVAATRRMAAARSVAWDFAAAISPPRRPADRLAGSTEQHAPKQAPSSCCRARDADARIARDGCKSVCVCCVHSRRASRWLRIRRLQFATRTRSGPLLVDAQFTIARYHTQHIDRAPYCKRGSTQLRSPDAASRLPARAAAAASPPPSCRVPPAARGC